MTRPCHSLDAFRWRLCNPVGLVGLAEQLVRDEEQHASEPGAAGFLVAEVAQTLRRTDWTPIERSLPGPAVRKELRAVQKRLRKLADGARAHSSLRGYVDEVFRR